MWLEVEKPCRTPYMCWSLRSIVKPSKDMGTLEAYMGIGNLSTLTLKSTEWMGMIEGLCSREGVPSLCCVSGCCGAILACSQERHLWSSWREPLVCIGEGIMRLYFYVLPDKPSRGVGLETIDTFLMNLVIILAWHWIIWMLRCN